MRTYQGHTCKPDFFVRKHVVPVCGVLCRKKYSQGSARERETESEREREGERKGERERERERGRERGGGGVRKSFTTW